MERITHYKRGDLSSFGVTALLVALLLTAVSTSVLVLNLSRLNASRADVARINTVLKQVGDLHEAVRAAETGQRGFLLTREPRYLATYEQGVPRVWNNLKEAEQTVLDPQQIKRLASLRALVESKLDELANTVALHARSQNAALQVVRSDVGQQLMEQIDTSIREIRDAGAHALESRSASEQQDAAWSTT